MYIFVISGSLKKIKKNYFDEVRIEHHTYLGFLCCGRVHVRLPKVQRILNNKICENKLKL